MQSICFIENNLEKNKNYLFQIVKKIKLEERDFAKQITDDHVMLMEF
jgi:hypothetical protein